MHTRVLVDLSLVIYLCPRNEGAGEMEEIMKKTLITLAAAALVLSGCDHLQKKMTILLQ